MKPYPIGGTLTYNIAINKVGGYNEKYFKDNPLNNTGIEICSNIIKCKAESSDRGLHPAQNLNRRYIGIEVSEEYCDVISKRLNKS